MRGQRPAPDGSTSTTVWPVGRDRYTGVENPGPVRTGSRTRLRGGRRLATILGRAVTGGLAPDPCDGLLPACTRRSVLPGTLRPRRRRRREPTPCSPPHHPVVGVAAAARAIGPGLKRLGQKRGQTLPDLHSESLAGCMRAARALLGRAINGVQVRGGLPGRCGRRCWRRVRRSRSPIGGGPLGFRRGSGRCGGRRASALRIPRDVLWR